MLNKFQTQQRVLKNKNPAFLEVKYSVQVVHRSKVILLYLSSVGFVKLRFKKKTASQKQIKL